MILIRESGALICFDHEFSRSEHKRKAVGMQPDDITTQLIGVGAKQAVLFFSPETKCDRLYIIHFHLLHAVPVVYQEKVIL